MEQERPDGGPGHPVYAIGDVHGCFPELTAALWRAGLTSGDAARWTGGPAHLWFLGDLTDRGPDGISVIELVMRLQREAADAGGLVGCVLGNHEVMLLAAHRFGSRRLHHLALPIARNAKFRDRWVSNGGQDSDGKRLTDAHMDWLSGLPAMVRLDEHLLVHADTTGYLDLGRDLDEVNTTVKSVLEGRDAQAWDDLTHAVTRRFAFASDEGETARDFLDRYGSSQIVHGHSPIPLLLGIEAAEVTGPLVYAEGLAVNMDTGTFLGGPCLVNPL